MDETLLNGIAVEVVFAYQLTVAHDDNAFRSWFGSWSMPE